MKSNHQSVSVDCGGYDAGVLAYYRTQTAQSYFNKLPAELDSDQCQWLERNVLEHLAIEERILCSPEAAGVVVPDSVMRRSLTEIEEKYEDRDQFLNDINQMGLSYSRFHDLIERQHRTELILEQRSKAQTTVSEQEALEYYQQNPKKFQKPERRHVWHLLITLNDDYQENQRPAVLERLQRIRAESESSLDSFKQHAKRHSECPSALSEGEVGWVVPGQLYSQLDQALFQLQANSVSEVLETELGLHLVYCQAIEPAGIISFDQVAEQIQQKLSQARKRKAQAQWIKSLG